MPIIECYKARSASEKEDCFFNRTTNQRNSIATENNVIMAQPMVAGIPPFCLVAFGSDKKYTAEDVTRRWEHIVSELEKKNISIVSIGSVSAHQYNATMRRILKFNPNAAPEMPKWFNTEFQNVSVIPFQDVIHIGTKFRNRILNRDLKFGEHTISKNHLIQLINIDTKDKHNLSESAIDGRDRQNFDSVLRLTNEKVTNLLISKVELSEGTVLYLTVIRRVLRAFLDLTLKPLERIRNLLFATFILRIWKTFNKTSKFYKLKDHFVTNNCYSCVEINSHAMVILILKLKGDGLDHLFRPELIGSRVKAISGICDR